MTTTVEYYFTPLSGFAYLGHDRLKNITDKAGTEIVYRPVLIAAVFEANGSVPPAKQSAARLDYRRADMKRWAEHFSLPINLEPRYWPVPDVFAGRCIAAASMLGLDAHATASALMKGVWVDEKNISEPDDVMGLLIAAGLDAGKILDAVKMEDVAARQKLCTDEAIEKGVFGSPTYVLDGELFWGQDRLSFLAKRLGLDYGSDI